MAGRRSAGRPAGVVVGVEQVLERHEAAKGLGEAVLPNQVGHRRLAEFELVAVVVELRTGPAQLRADHGRGKRLPADVEAALRRRHLRHPVAFEPGLVGLVETRPRPGQRAGHRQRGQQLHASLDFEPSRADHAGVATLPRDQRRRRGHRHVGDGVLEAGGKERGAQRHATRFPRHRYVTARDALHLERGIVLRERIAGAERPQALVERRRAEGAIAAGAQRDGVRRRPRNRALRRHRVDVARAARRRVDVDGVGAQAADHAPRAMRRPRSPARSRRACPAVRRQPSAHPRDDARSCRPSTRLASPPASSTT